MLKMLKFILPLGFMVLLGAACDPKGQNNQPTGPVCIPGQQCIVNPIGQCPFGSYYNGMQCVPGNQNPAGMKHYYGNISISNTKAAENIYEVLTGQWFCWGFGGFNCPSFNQGTVQIYVYQNNTAQVQMGIGSYSSFPLVLGGFGNLTNINNNAGSQINTIINGLAFTFTTNNYRLDLGGTKDGQPSSQAALQVLYNNSGFGSGTITKY